MNRTIEGKAVVRLRTGESSDRVAAFNQQVREETGPLLQQFAAELEALKTAVGKSVAKYSGTDSGSGRSIDSSGGGL